MARPHPAGRAPRPPAAVLSERRWLAFALAVALAELALLILTATPHARAAGPGLPLALVACIPIVALRRWPLPVLAVTTAAMAVILATGAASLPFGLAIGLAAYGTAASRPRRVSIPAAAAAAAVLSAAVIYAAAGVPFANPATEALVGLVPLVAAWFVGDTAAARQRYLAGLAEQAERERAAEADHAQRQVREERVRIAHELHDVVAHTLAVITVQAGVGRRLMARNPEAAGSALESIEMIGRTAQDELRVVLGLLRDESAGAAALTPAPRLADLKELADSVRALGTPVDLRLPDGGRPLSPALELSIYRVVQEALTNVVKHAPGAQAEVELAFAGGEVRIEVTDHGPPGGVLTAAQRGPGHGIVGMRERIAAFGGRLAAGPLDGGGFRVRATIPAEGAG
jgi:signal transduction histidine kinase